MILSFSLSLSLCFPLSFSPLSLFFPSPLSLSHFQTAVAAT